MSVCESDIHFLGLGLISMLNGLLTPHSKKLVKLETLADQAKSVQKSTFDICYTA